MRAYVCVRKGLNGKECEDRCIVGGKLIAECMGWFEFETPAVVALADGVGGNAGGDKAAAFVGKNVHAALGTCRDERAVRRQLVRTNAALLRTAAGNAQLSNMATTLTGAVLMPGLERDVRPLVVNPSPAPDDAEVYVPRRREPPLLLFHVGNTRAYALNHGHIQRLTQDHTTYAQLMRQGQPALAETCNPNEINCCFGGGEAALLGQLEVTKAPVCETLILTSDGLHDHLPEAELLAALCKLNQANAPHISARLARLARANGSRDDLSICIAFAR